MNVEGTCAQAWSSATVCTHGMPAFSAVLIIAFRAPLRIIDHIAGLSIAALMARDIGPDLPAPNPFVVASAHVIQPCDACLEYLCTMCCSICNICSEPMHRPHLSNMERVVQLHGQQRSRLALLLLHESALALEQAADCRLLVH